MPMCRGSLLILALVLSTAGCHLLAQTPPETPDEIFARAVRLQQAGDIQAAVREYRTLLALRPDQVSARSNLGAALARLGRYQEAIEEYKRALEFEGSNTSIRFNLALAFYKSASIPEAAKELNQVVAAQPENKNAILLLADCFLQMGEFKKVIELLSPFEETSQKSALAPEADERAIEYLLGTALIRDNQTEKGQVLIDRILREGDSAEARLMLATAQLMARDYPNALKDLKLAVELNPKLPSAHSFYGRALLQTGDRDSAKKAFEKELEGNPNDFESNLYLGIIYREDQKYDEALNYLQRALLVRPRELNVRYFIGSIYLSQGKVDDAQRVLEDVVKEAPDFVEAHVILATVYYRVKRKDDGDRERAVIQKLNAERQAKAPGAQEGLGPAYRGEKFPEVGPASKPNNKPPQ
ncbi:MAG TPA: tetratricopeptide repeat protein [Acidobacteriota bacterium]